MRSARKKAGYIASFTVRDAVFAAVLLAVCGALFFSFMGLRGLWETDEARYAEMAREMVETGDWATPRLNYVKYFEKPPLACWLVAISFKLFGISDASARLMPAVFGTLTVLLVFLLGRSLWEGRAGFFAGLSLAASFMFFALSRVLLVDMVLCFGVVLALYGAWELRGGRSFGLYLFWLGCAAGFLSKGLLGPGLPVMAVVLFCLASGEWPLAWRLAYWRGPLLFGLLCAPWVIWVSLVNPEFFRFFFIDEHLGRLLTDRHQRAEPFYFYFWLVPAAFFPWTALLPWAIWRDWPGRGWRTPGRRPFLFVAVWFISFFLFLSLSSSKMLHYGLPMMPALALLLGPALASFPFKDWQRPCPKGISFSLAVLAVLVMAAGLVVLLVPALNPDIHYQQVGMFLLLGPALAAGAGLLIFLLRARLGAFWGAPLFIFAVVVACVALAAPALDPYRSLAGLMKPLQAELKPADMLVTYGDHYYGVPFYGGRRAAVVGNWGELDFGRRLDPEARKWFLPDDQALIRLLQNPRVRVLAVSETAAYERFRKKAGGVPGLLLFEWARLGDKSLFCNRPHR